MKWILLFITALVGMNDAAVINTEQQSIDERFVEDVFKVDEVPFFPPYCIEYCNEYGELVRVEGDGVDIVSTESKADNVGILALKPVSDAIDSSKPNIEWKVSFGRVFWMIIIFLFAYMMIKYFTKALESIAEKWVASRLFIKRVIPVFRLTGWVITIYIMIVGVLAPPIETVLAVTASFGIAMGFASQDILKNIFGGIMILFDNPFQVGDKIQVGNHYGEVIHIGLRSVRIVTPDDSVVSIPNSDIVSQPVSNSNSGEFNCQVVAEFYFPAEVDLAKLKKLATRAARVSKYVFLKKPVVVSFKNEVHEHRSMIKMRLKAYVLDLRYEFAFATEMSEIVITEALKQGLVTPEQMSS